MVDIWGKVFTDSWGNGYTVKAHGEGFWCNGYGPLYKGDALGLMLWIKECFIVNTSLSFLLLLYILLLLERDMRENSEKRVKRGDRNKIDERKGKLNTNAILQLK